MLRTPCLLLAASLVALTPCTTRAEPDAMPAADPDVAVSPGFWSRFRPSLDLRARLEHADQDGRDAAASWTLRGRLGLLAQLREGWTGFAEIEHTRTANRQGYQAASVHGLGENKVVVADPETFELNQLWLAYTGNELAAKAGIQRVIVENARFIGNVGWRQNEQTFDGVTLRYEGIEKLALSYGYLYNVRRIFGSERRRAPAQRDYDSRSHFVTASYALAPALRLTGYGYFLDLQNAAGADDSNDTLGASLTGVVPAGPAELGYRLEYASQTDAGDSALDYRARYRHLHASAAIGRFSAGIGYEELGAGDGVGFNTPLATLHAFNGFADTFLVTPGVGLRDVYLEAGVALPLDFSLRAVYHDFRAEDHSSDLGYELDLVLARPLRWGMKAMLKAAFYQAEEGGFVDTQRLVFQLEYGD